MAPPDDEPTRSFCVSDKDPGRRGTHPVEAGLSAELVGLGGAEVVVGSEGLVECCDEVEEGLPATLVTQRAVPVLAALPQPTHTHTQVQIRSGQVSADGFNRCDLHHSLGRASGAGGLRGGESLQDVWLPLLAELLEHMLVVPCHLAGVALDPAGGQTFCNIALKI